MCQDSRVQERRRPLGPGVERSITLTDAVVAIAMTLLILPLVEVSGETRVDSLSELLSEQGALLLSFVISFLVIYAFWAAHGTIHRRLTEAGIEDLPWLDRLNMLWLLVVAFLPLPTALVGHDLNTTTAPIYVGTMLVLSALTSGLAVVARHAVGDSNRLDQAWLTTAVFALCTAVAFFFPNAAMYGLLLLILVRWLEVHVLAQPRGAST